MSRDLRIAFFGEGSTDSRVVPIMIEKIIRELTPLEPFSLQIVSQNWDTRRSFPDAFVRVAQQAQPLYNMMVAHLDADAPDERQVRERKIEPAERALAVAQLSTFSIIWAIPVQAIEAWLPVSAEAFATALTGQVDRAHELAMPRDPERIHRDDARRLFEESIYQLLANTRRKRKRIKPGRFQADVADEISLRVLRRLPAFQRFENDLTGALVTLGYALRSE